MKANESYLFVRIWATSIARHEGAARHHRPAQTWPAVGVYSLCSAHPVVIEAAMYEALAGNTPLLIEATSNQVNQFGGYTGMTPAAFYQFVHLIATHVAFPADRLWLGGDHLGPNP